jgi:hypothetical protein
MHPKRFDREQSDGDRSLFGTYDKWFTGRSPVTTIQFCGLMVIGGALLLGSITFVVVLFRGLKSPVVIADGLLMLLGLAICVSIGYFGVLHIKRAFVGKRW